MVDWYLALNREIMLPENAPVQLTSVQLEALNYEKLYRAYSPTKRTSVAFAAPFRWRALLT